MAFQQWAMAGLTAVLAAGCANRPEFPARALSRTAERVDYDSNGDGKADFFCYPDSTGRYDRIGYDRDGDGKPDRIIHLDAIDKRFCRHLVIVLDGFPYDVVKEFYDGGGLRFLHPPVVVIPPYPVMTDLALEDAFGYMPCAGYEAKYFDHSANRVVGGTSAYLAGKNEPFARIITYRSSTLRDGFAYLNPRQHMRQEIQAVRQCFQAAREQETIAYIVSSAAMGSRLGKEGQIEALRQCEQLITSLYCQMEGMLKVTLLADHGQTNVPCTSAKLDEFLRTQGWRLVDRLAGPRDVALIQFGLETSAALYTLSPAALAEDLLSCDKVELASYVDGDSVVVASREGKAIIRSSDGKTFEYERVRGDPLKLGELAEGKVAGRELLQATVQKRSPYPDPLYRLWRAHFGLVEHPADVIVSLDDRYYNGAGGFASFVTMASTHGGLNWRNSATFIASSAGAIDGPLRSEDIPAAMRKLFDRPFPLGR